MTTEYNIYAEIAALETLIEVGTGPLSTYKTRLKYLKEKTTKIGKCYRHVSNKDAIYIVGDCVYNTDSGEIDYKAVLVTANKNKHVFNTVVITDKLVSESLIELNTSAISAIQEKSENEYIGTLFVSSLYYYLPVSFDEDSNMYHCLAYPVNTDAAVICKQVYPESLNKWEIATEEDRKKVLDELRNRNNTVHFALCVKELL